MAIKIIDGLFLYQTHSDHHKMKNPSFLILFGLLALSQAENGYNYNPPSLQLSESQSATSFQQTLPPQQLTLNQHQQGSSYQQSLPQSSYIPQGGSGLYQGPISHQAPQSVSYQQSFPAPQQHFPVPQQSFSAPQQNFPVPQQSFSAPQQHFPVPQQSFSAPQQLSLSESQQSSSFQQSLPQHSAPSPAPQLFNVVPQQSFSAPQQLSLSENQQSSSFQQNLPQLSPPPPAPQLFNVNTQSSSYQNNLPSLPAPPISQAPLPQLVNYFPQVGANLDIPQNIPQLQLQPQGQNLQVPSQIQQNFGSQQQVLSPIPQQPQFASQQFGLPEQGHSVTKNIYFHVAPEEPPQPPQILPTPLPPKKNYKIIFIKAPSASPSQSQLIHLAAAQQPVEEKTLVYVLVGKPQQPEIQIQPPAPVQSSKPEVYFIKYKAPGLPGPVGPTAPGPILADSPPTGSLPIVEDVKRGQGESVNSGEDSSSLFSGGLPAPSSSYGPPGYQKRNT